MTESQKKISAILHEIINNEEEILENYYGIAINIYKNIDKYLNRLESIYDQIYVAQWCNHIDKARELIAKLDLPEDEKQKYQELKEKNIEIDETLNFKILSKKYQFLDNIMDMITADLQVQDQILSLSDSRLKIFEKMYLRIQQLTDYYNPYITSILQIMGYVSLDTHWKNKNHIYDHLLKELEEVVEKGEELTDREIETLLFLFTSSIQYTIPNLDEMRRFGEKDTIDQQESEEMVAKAKQEKDVETLKFAILAKSYGIHIDEAKRIVDQYHIEEIELTSENMDVFEIYLSLVQIIKETDPDVLTELYDEIVSIMNPEMDFRRMIVFENDLRKAFARDLNQQIWMTDNQPHKEMDGVEVYDAGTDFKMIITVIGAYQDDFTTKENYSKYWNSPLIRSHGNCCSLIGNSNLSMAPVKNVILGFSTMSDNMLLLSRTRDINSTPDSRKFDTTGIRAQEYKSADQMLDDTRSDYNELVYERRDLGSNPKFFKKNPDYIVYIEEYEKEDFYLEKYKDDSEKIEYMKNQRRCQEKYWQESKKAAMDFGVPIVKINRETVAKSERKKMEDMVEDFKETRDMRLMKQVITKFESNRVGNARAHDLIREEYFSEATISRFLKEMKDSIEEEKEPAIKKNLYLALYHNLMEEQEKVKKALYQRNQKQTPGIHFEKEMEEVFMRLEGAERDREEERVDENRK